MSTKIETLVDKIATGKKRGVVVPRKDLADVAEKLTKKYWGEVVWFGLGETAHVYRKKTEPMKLKKAKVKA